MLITDGEDHDVPAAVPDTLNPDDGNGHHTLLPLHVLLTGKGETDRHLRVLQAPPFAIVGKDVTIRVQIDDQGHLPSPAPPRSSRSRRAMARPSPGRSGLVSRRTLPCPSPTRARCWWACPPRTARRGLHAQQP